jgi:predicted metal-dependent enzyme (double-stranded beta helix superfamily)
MKERDASRGSETSRRAFLLAASSAPAFVISSFEELSRAAPLPRPVPARLDLDRFVSDCVEAARESDPRAAVLEVLARTVRDPARVRDALGETRDAGLRVLHRSKTLTVFSATWTPNMTLMPHDHRMWAAIGLYAGREDNILWRRSPGRIEAFGAKALFEGDTVALEADAIHSVTNPLSRFTGGIHAYGGDFFDRARSQWNPETLAEEPSDGEAIRGIFRRENERARRCAAP